MAIYLATQTLKRIDEMIEADQGASFRYWEGITMRELDDAYRNDPPGHRSHLGASQIGHKCARALWYGFHWATPPKVPARALRLFNRGHLEEGRFVAMLRMIGCEVYQYDANGKQFRISAACGHFGGSGDGVAVGIPDLQPGQPCVTEWKTHNDKSYKHLIDVGVKEAKPEHYVQMNCYMRKMAIPIALYGAVNKNDDSIYMELIPLDVEVADQYLDRGQQIVWLPKPPDRISTTPGHFECKWCDHRRVCWGLDAPERNCRTCTHSCPSNANDNAEWRCRHPVQPMGQPADVVIPKELMVTGCTAYLKGEM